jgi:hypothetical protein
MNEPKRLLEEPGSSFERSLLSALANERPSPELARRMHQGITIAGVATGAKLAAAGHGALAWVGLVAAGLAAGVAASEAPVRPAAVAPVVAPAAPRPAAVAPPPESAAPLAVAAPVAAPEQAASPLRVRSTPARGGDLHEEIRLLDGARSAVRGDRPHEALKLLARYERQYPSGQFRQEMLVLRVEALQLAGKAQAAQDLGKRFLSEHPESPHAERIERVTEPR